MVYRLLLLNSLKCEECFLSLGPFASTCVCVFVTVEWMRTGGRNFSRNNDHNTFMACLNGPNGFFLLSKI